MKLEQRCPTACPVCGSQLQRTLLKKFGFDGEAATVRLKEIEDNCPNCFYWYYSSDGDGGEINEAIGCIELFRSFFVDDRNHDERIVARLRKRHAVLAETREMHKNEEWQRIMARRRALPSDREMQPAAAFPLHDELETFFRRNKKRYPLNARGYRKLQKEYKKQRNEEESDED